MLQLPAASGRRVSKGGSPNAALDGDLPAQLGSLGPGGHLSAGLRSWTGSQDLRRDSSQRTTNDRASLSDSVARIALTSQLRLPGLVDACPGLCCGLDASAVSQIDSVWMTTRGPGAHALEPPQSNLPGRDKRNDRA